MPKKIIVNPQPFIFKQINDQVKRQVETDPFRLRNAFFMNKADGHQIFLTLTSKHILVYEPLKYRQQYFSYTQIDFSLKFEILYELDGKAHQSRSILSKQVGFRLMVQSGQKVQFYAKNQPTADIWVSYLAKKINQYGFHKMYKPIKKIGKGGFATVFEVQRIRDKKHFAVKAFTKKQTILSENENYRNNLMKQIQSLRLFNSQNIIECQGIYQSNNSIYIVLELLPYGHLHNRINRKQAKFSTYQIKQFVYGMAVALMQMHQKRIMHRDIKPENIMLRGQEGLDPVIVDFGLAVDVDSQDYIFIRCGTPGYVAPEVVSLKKGQHIEPECDIFSLGAILHILLMKRTLFQGSNSQQVYDNNRRMNFNLNHLNYESVDKEGLDLLKRMLCLDPKKRIKAFQIIQHPYLTNFIEYQTSISPASTNESEKVNFAKLSDKFQ